MPRQRLSVIIICRNEADRIRHCLQSVHPIADEIVVLDSGSTDNTVEICRQFTDNVYVTDWPGYGPQKQRALEYASGDWVLSLDADEHLTDELQHNIAQLLEKPIACAAYWIPSLPRIYGRIVRHGRFRKYVLRLFRREGARFTNSAVHEHIVPAKGKVCRLRAPLIHETFRDFRHAAGKQETYAWLWANEKHGGGKMASPIRGVLSGIWAFVQDYFLRAGFLDDKLGLFLAVQSAFYTFNKYAALWYLTEFDMPDSTR